jgi:hypothetical protein
MWWRLSLATLATWRITAYLVYESNGQWIRDAAKTYAVDEDGTPVTLWGKVLSCFWCTSLIVSGVCGGASLLSIWWVLLPFAVSGAAILLNHVARIYLVMER